jgi:molecular chaperone GrpE
MKQRPRELSWKQAPSMFRRKHRVMAEQENELSVSEPLEIASGGPVEEPQAGQAASPADGEAPAGPVEPVSRAEFEQLKAERDQLLDRLARLQAEFENARKRAERERIADRDYAAGSVVEKFLPVVDNFQLALKSHGTAQQMRHGVELIVKQMEEILRQMQVVPIPAVGEPFDPRLHEALGAVDRDDLPDQHIAEEIRRGYRLRERLLRPALVRIVHNSKQTAE